MHASLFAMLGTLVMAIVPGFSNAMSSSAAHASAATPLTTLSLLLPPLPASARQAAHVERNNWQLVNVAKGETLSHVFERLRSEEHTSELQSLMRISYAVFCLKKKKKSKHKIKTDTSNTSHTYRIIHSTYTNIYAYN